MKLPTLPGKLFVPEPCPDHLKRHPCEDCAFCQQCSEERCALCRREPGRVRATEEEPAQGTS